MWAREPSGDDIRVEGAAVAWVIQDVPSLRKPTVNRRETPNVRRKSPTFRLTALASALLAGEHGPGLQVGISD